MADLKTVKVKSADGAKSPFVVINETDFDPKKHTLYEDKPVRRKRNQGKRAE